MKKLTLVLLAVSLNVQADDYYDYNDSPALEGEVIETYSSSYNPIEQHYEATTESGKTIRGSHSDLGGIEVDQWTTTDSDGNTNSVRCESYHGNTFCN